MSHNKLKRGMKDSYNNLIYIQANNIFIENQNNQEFELIKANELLDMVVNNTKI